jgi:FtsP/CotA-like multicopper oxidase with cupredoxin domain
VHNQLADEEGLSLHFHGMWNVAAPFADGTALSQCPIPPGESFVYDFSVGDQVGTYLYHGHRDTLQPADGLYGPLVIEDPEAPVAYDEERWVELGVLVVSFMGLIKLNSIHPTTQQRHHAQRLVAPRRAEHGGGARPAAVPMDGRSAVHPPQR